MQKNLTYTYLPYNGQVLRLFFSSSKLECNEWDHDITKCVAELPQDIENSCSPHNVVGIRCYDSSWAGIRMAITAEKSVLKYAIVEKAGLLDPHTNEHKPGKLLHHFILCLHTVFYLL